MIEIKRLTKAYDKAPVLRDVNLAVPDKSVFGLVGINGAGKSTLLRLISGVLKADNGIILIDGEPVYENEAAKRQIFFLPDDPYYTSNINGSGLAELYKTFYDFDAEVYGRYLDQFKLSPKAPIRNFSKGMKRQVFVSLALAVRPKYLLLDEAFDGLDPLARMVFKRGVIDLVEEKGSTVIISSHSLRELEDICDSYGLLDHQTITCSGEIETDVEKLHKFQAAFENGFDPNALGLPYMSFSRTGRVVKIVAKGDAEEIVARLNAFHPMFIEEIPVDFEELFTYEVESRGYLK